MRDHGSLGPSSQASSLLAAGARTPRLCKPRTRRDVTIWSLPEEILLLIFRYVHVKDLLTLQSVHRWFKQITDANCTVWRRVSFQNTWPTMPNLHHFEKAAACGSLSAALKLGIAYLYNEGLPGDSDGTRIKVNGEKAAEMFCQVESMQRLSSTATSCEPSLPFTWLFVRPPWSPNGSCCKEIAFQAMCSYAETTKESSVVACIAKIALMLEGQQYSALALRCLEIAASGSATSLFQHRSIEAAFLLWCQRHGHAIVEKSLSLEQVRSLRDIVAMGMHPDAHCTLAMIYAAGNYGGIARQCATSFVRQFVTKASQTHIHEVLQHSSEVNHSMRFILVDWLVEVVTMKGFNSLTLHTCINIVDRFLECHSVTRSTVQLLGVAAMVICSRCLGKDIITISEACWLTDNSYQYEDVVRMMAEIVATLRGRIRTLTTYDCLKVVCTVAETTFASKCLAEYYYELVLLRTDISSSFRPAVVAASCVLLAQLSTCAGNPWPQNAIDFTGLTLDMIKACTLQIRMKCCKDGSPVDHRDAKLQAVWSRYDTNELCKASRMDSLCLEKLWAFLGVSNNECSQSDSTGELRFRNTANLIASPSLKHTACSRRSLRQTVKDRQSTTPVTAEQQLLGIRKSSTSADSGTPTLPNDSIISGSDGDREDAEDTVQDVIDFADDELFSDSRSTVGFDWKDDPGFPYDKMDNDYDDDDEDDDDDEGASLYRSGISIRFSTASPLGAFGTASQTSVQVNPSGIVIHHQRVSACSSVSTTSPSNQHQSVGFSSIHRSERSTGSGGQPECRPSHRKRAAAAASYCSHSGSTKRLRRT